MDRTWIYRNIHLIISLLLIRTSEISSKEYYCTKAGTWREAMTNCTESGGVPVSYRDVYNSTAFTLKDNRTVWTADYVYLEYVTDIAQGKSIEGYECGYKTTVYKGARGIFHYFTLSGIQYGRCTESKHYFCDSSKTENRRRGPSTWNEAISDCSSDQSFTLWDGYYISRYKKVENFEIWDRGARRVTQGIVNDSVQGETTEVYECGYKTIVYKWTRGTYHYFTLSGIQYGRCTESKHYFCDSSTTEYLRRGPSTWDEAISDCSSDQAFTLKDGYYISRYSKVDNFEKWDQRARRVTKGLIGGTITIDDNNIETCGTNVEEVKRYNNSNCEEHWESLCVFGETVTDTDTFTRTCFEDETTEVSVIVTRRPIAGSTIITSADGYDNNGSKERQAENYIIIVVATVIASLTVCCILIGIGSFCYRKQRRKVNKKNYTVRYVNENLPTTTTDRNSPDTNGSVNDRANAEDIAFENYEAYDAQRGRTSMDDVYTTTEEHGEYGNVYSACRIETISENTHNAAAIPTEESEYDSTRNIKEYDKSSNIYNTLGFEGAESMYDSGHYNKDKGLQVDSTTYSSCSIQDYTYNTTAGLNDSRQNHGHGLLPSHDNVYSISTNDTNQHDTTYLNIATVHQTADGSSIYDTAYHNGT